MGCQCSTGWSGPTCEQAIVCANQPCKNGGTCQDFGTYASCACPQYLTGPTCEAVDCSGSNPCYNGGTCSGAKCLCMPGYSGILCWTQT
ncbi:hypothetical protein DFJ74DRAFT_655836 [Hyaloraphidium curvatum]|nr:hypothetical protein DFJ74DRAFT_655836 [Hyaloraphidium curvatum]